MESAINFCVAVVSLDHSFILNYYLQGATSQHLDIYTTAFAEQRDTEEQWMKKHRVDNVCRYIQIFIY